jgi:hypothetical protein
MYAALTEGEFVLELLPKPLVPTSTRSTSLSFGGSTQKKNGMCGNSRVERNMKIPFYADILKFVAGEPNEIEPGTAREE